MMLASSVLRGAWASSFQPPSLVRSMGRLHRLFSATSASSDREGLPLTPSDAERRNEEVLSKVMFDFEEAKAKGLLKDGFEDLEELGEGEDETEWVTWRADGADGAMDGAAVGAPAEVAKPIKSRGIGDIRQPLARDVAYESLSLPSPSVEAGGIFPQLKPLQNEAGKTVDLNKVLTERGLFIFTYPRSNLLAALTYPWDEIRKCGYEIFGIGYEKPALQALQLTKPKNKHFKGDLLCDTSREAIGALGLLKDEGKGVLRSHIIVEKGGRVLMFEKKVTPKKSVAAVSKFLGIVDPRIEQSYFDP